MTEAKKILGIIGLGYVGLPLAYEFSKYFTVIGFDVNIRRIKELREEILLDIKSQRIDFENCLKEREQSLYFYWNQRLNEDASFELNAKGEISPMDGTSAL